MSLEDISEGAWGPLGSMISAWRRAGPVGVPPFMARQGVVWEPGRVSEVSKTGTRLGYSMAPRLLDTPELKGRALPHVRR